MTLSTVCFTEKRRVTSVIHAFYCTSQEEICMCEQWHSKMRKHFPLGGFVKLLKATCCPAAIAQTIIVRTIIPSHCNNNLIVALPTKIILLLLSLYMCLAQPMHSTIQLWQNKTCKSLLPRCALGNPKTLWKKNI